MNFNGMNPSSSSKNANSNLNNPFNRFVSFQPPPAPKYNNQFAGNGRTNGNFSRPYLRENGNFEQYQSQNYFADSFSEMSILSQQVIDNNGKFFYC